MEKRHDFNLYNITILRYTNFWFLIRTTLGFFFIFPLYDFTILIGITIKVRHWSVRLHDFRLYDYNFKMYNYNDFSLYDFMNLFCLGFLF